MEATARRQFCGVLDAKPPRRLTASVGRKHNMRKTLLVSLLFVAAMAVSALLGYRAGSHRRYTWIRSDFVGSFAALQNLRKGDTAAAIERLEAKCFSTANVLYGTPEFRNDPMPGWFLKDLRAYRAMYRTNSAEWYPTEHLLEQNLAAWK